MKRIPVAKITFFISLAVLSLGMVGWFWGRSATGTFAEFMFDFGPDFVGAGLVSTLVSGFIAFVKN